MLVYKYVYGLLLCLYVCMSVCLSLCLSDCLSLSPSLPPLFLSLDQSPILSISGHQCTRFDSAGHGHHRGHHHDGSHATEPDLTSSVTLDRARSQWRTLSFALIAVLCVVCGLVVFVGLYVFTVCRRSKAQKRYFREPGKKTQRHLSLRRFCSVDSVFTL